MNIGSGISGMFLGWLILVAILNDFDLKSQK